MTSLIDVIFLLLLFFMLSSTFTRFAEVELAASGVSGAGSAEQKPVFLRLGADNLSLNGQAVALEALTQTLREEAPPVLVSLQNGVSAQRLTDLLVVLRGIPNLPVTVLGAS